MDSVSMSEMHQHRSYKLPACGLLNGFRPISTSKAACRYGAIFLLFALCPTFAEAPPTPKTFTGLPAAADAQVARYMNLLIQDPRNDFLFGEVFRIYKTHKLEYRLLSFLKGSIKAKPDEKNLWILLGLAYTEFRDLYLARKYFNKAIEIDPKDYLPRFLTAQVLLREGKIDEAIAGFRNSADIASDPEDKMRAREALAGAFLSQEKEGNVEKATAELDAILKEREFDTQVHWRVARIYEDHFLHEQAVQHFQNLVELAGDDDPELACRSWMRIAGISQETSKQEEAIAAYLKARELIDDQHWLSEKINSQILELYRASGQTDAWLKELQSRIEKRPRDVELRKEAARALAADRKIQEAHDQLMEAAKVAPEDVSVLEEIIRLKASEAEKTENETNRQKLYAELPSVYARLREINNENLDYVVREGEAWWKAGNQDKALETWNEIISEEETEIRRHELLGATLLRQKRFDEGIAALRKGIELDPSRDDLRMQIGEVLLQQNKVDEAQKEFQSITERSAATEVTYLRVASLYEGINLGDRVLKTLEQAAKAFPDSYDIQFRLGALLVDSAPIGDNPKAREALWKAFLTGPTHRARLVANMKLLKTYTKRSKLTERMRKHVADNPTDLTALLAIGDIETGYEGSTAGRKVEMSGGGHVGQGQMAYKTVQAKDPLYLAAYEHNASLLIAGDRFEDAVLEYRKMVVVNPVNKWAYWLRIGDLFADQGQMREAGVYWDFIRERNISDPQILYQLGARMLRAERYADALKLIEIAAVLHPNDYRLRLSLGHLYEHFHNYEKSVRSYTRAIQLATSDLVLPVRMHLGRIQRLYGEQLWTQGNTRKALDVFQSSQAFLEKLKEVTGETPPEYPNVMVQVARCLEALGQKDEAAKAYRAAAEGFPETWVWVNSRTEMWLPFFEKLRSQGKHQFTRQEPELQQEIGNRVRAELAGKAWPIAQILGAYAAPGRIHVIGMDSKVTLNTSDLTWQRQPLPMKYEQRLKTRMFPPYLLIRPLEKVGEGVLWNPRYNKLYDVSTGTHDIYAIGTLKKVASIPRHEDIGPWPAQSGNRFYFHAGNSVLGFDLSTGKALWERKNAYKSDSIRILASSPKYVSVTESTDEFVRFQILDATTGKRIVTINPGTFHFWRTPLILGDTFFSYDDFDGMLVAWKLPEGRPLYRAKFGGQLAAEIQSPDGNTLLIHHRKLKERKIILSAIDTANGQTRWQTHLKLESIDRGPVIADSRILYVYRYRPEQITEPAYEKPGPFHRANRGVLVIDRSNGQILSDIDLTPFMSDRTIQDIREAFYQNNHLFLLTHDAKTFKLKLTSER